MSGIFTTYFTTQSAGEDDQKIILYFANKM